MATSITADMVKALRQATGAPILECRNALEETAGDVEKAAALLRERGIAAAEERAGRETRNGMLELYSHGGGRVGVIVEVNCETDFVARTKEFRALAHEIALQIAGAEPLYLDAGDVPPEVVEEQREKARKQALEEGKPAAVVDKMVEGRLSKYHDEVCLLRQPYVRDESKTVTELLKEAIAATGENITIRRFVRWTVGEA